MTTATLVVSRSQYTTAPHHAHFSASTSTYTTSDIYDAQFQWWVQDLSDGSTVASNFSGPEFGYVFETPGSYRITLKTKGSGDGDWTEDFEDITVGTPSYSASCYVDMDAGVDGSGTIGSPFNVMASAFTYIYANWVAGATNEHCIYVKKGTAEAVSTGFGTKTVLGRLVIQPYSTGTIPTWNLGGNDITLLTTQDNHAFALVGIKVDGEQAFPQTAATKELIYSLVNETNAPPGHNLIVLNCEFIRTRYVSVVAYSSNQTSAFFSGGFGDFVATQGNTFTDCNANILVEGRYVLTTATTSRSSNAFNLRHKLIQHAFIKIVHTAQNGTEVPLRVHSNGENGLETDWVVVSQSSFLSAPWIQPHAGAGTIQPMRHVWICDSTMRGYQGQTKALDAFANEGLVTRNNVIRSSTSVDGANMVYRGSDAGTAVGVDWVIENNTFIHLTANGFGARKAIGFQETSGDVVTGVRLRNNLLVMPNPTGGSNCFMSCANGSAVPETLFSACDGNYFWLAAGTANWTAGFSAGAGSLATWQGATTFDDNSHVLVGGTDPLTDSEGATIDASLVAASGPIDDGVAAPGSWLDILGHIRTGTMDVGAHSYGDSTEPTAPSTAPDAPTVYVSVVTEASITVAIGGDGTQDSFEVHYSLTGIDDWAIFDDDVSSSATYVKVTGLDDETEYDIRVIAKLGAAESTPTDVTATTLGAPTPPSGARGPQFVVVDTITYNSAIVRWVDCTSDEYSYSVRLRNLETNNVVVSYAAANSTEKALTSLGSFTSYEVVVVAHSPTLGDAVSDTVPFVTLRAPTVPTAPTNLVATLVGLTSADFTFEDNSNDETAFLVTRTNLRTMHVSTWEIAANSESFRSSPLSSGTPYRFDVQARNAVGLSSRATVWIYTRTTAQTPPRDVSGLTLTATRQGELEYNYIDNSVNEIRFEVTLTRSGEVVARATRNMNETSGVFSGLVDDTVYTVTVVVIGTDNSRSDGVSATGRTWGGWPSVPDAPSDLVTQEVSSLTIRLNWVNNATNADSVRIYRKVNAGAYELEATVGASEVTYTDSDLATEAGDTVTYKLAAYNIAGESAFSGEDATVLSVPIEGDGDPTGLVATVVGDGVVVLTWVDNCTNESGTRIETSATSNTGPWDDQGDVAPDVTTFTLSGLTADTYWARVTNFDTIGDIGTSSVVTFTITGDSPAAPSPPVLDSAIATSTTTVYVKWTSGDVDTEAFLVRYRLSTDVAWTLHESVDPTETAHEVDALTPGTSYDFQVRAENGGGTGDSNVITVLTRRNQGGEGIVNGRGDRITISRSYNEDTADLTIISAAESPSLVETYRCAPSDATNGPFAELYVGEQVISRANPVTGVCAVKNYPLKAGETLTVRIRGTGNGVESFSGSIQQH